MVRSQSPRAATSRRAARRNRKGVDVFEGEDDRIRARQGRRRMSKVPISRIDSSTEKAGNLNHFAAAFMGQSQMRASGPPLPLARVLPSGANVRDSTRVFGPVGV